MWREFYRRGDVLQVEGQFVSQSGGFRCVLLQSGYKGDKALDCR